MTATFSRIKKLSNKVNYIFPYFTEILAFLRKHNISLLWNIIGYKMTMSIILHHWKYFYDFFDEKGNTNSLEYVIWRLYINHFCIFCDIDKLIFQIAPWKIAFSLNCCPFFHFQKALILFAQRKSNLRFTTHNWGIELMNTKPILIDNFNMA